LNILGIDFEDWFHPELIQKYISKENNEPRVVEGINKIIELLRKNETKATFFVVGELLEFKPELLDIILENEHEIAFHTMKHARIDLPNRREQFQDEIKQFDKLTGGRSKGFRAPSFSLNNNSSWLIDVLEENNYEYDSSVVPVKTSMYGIPNAERKPYNISRNFLEGDSIEGKIIEFPLLVTKFLGKKIPAGGGFYLRTLPLRVIENAIKSYEKEKMPGVFYIHSWELTPEFMPRINLSKKDNFITYHNINKAYNKMEDLLKKYEFTSFEIFLQNKSKEI
jgi:polysaccharide deacetylase family protein (PEP-CTERM system associated)